MVEQYFYTMHGVYSTRAICVMYDSAWVFPSYSLQHISKRPIDNISYLNPPNVKGDATTMEWEGGKTWCDRPITSHNKFPFVG